MPRRRSRCAYSCHAAGARGRAIALLASRVSRPPVTGSPEEIAQAMVRRSRAVLGIATARLAPRLQASDCMPRATRLSSAGRIMSARFALGRAVCWYHHARLKIAAMLFPAARVAVGATESAIEVTSLVAERCRFDRPPAGGPDADSRRSAEIARLRFRAAPLQLAPRRRRQASRPSARALSDAFYSGLDDFRRFGCFKRADFITSSCRMGDRFLEVLNRLTLSITFIRSRHCRIRWPFVRNFGRASQALGGGRSIVTEASAIDDDGPAGEAFSSTSRRHIGQRSPISIGRAMSYARPTRR